MALIPITPRDKLQRVTDLARKTARHWWLLALFALAGGALSLTFAVMKAKKYQSWATLFYQERIQSSLMTPNREEMVQRNIGDRYRELLLARSQLETVIKDPKLNPFPDATVEDALEELRKRIRFEARGANAFRITYQDDNPQRAKAVTAKLTELLQSKDEELRNDQAARTVNFATTQKEAASKELGTREQQLAMFLAQHPEFAQDSATQNTEGASIRAIRDAKPTKAPGNPRLYALERQRQRIQARLDAPPDSAPIRIATAPSPERAAAEAAANDAQRELAAAQRELDDTLTRVTDKHPSAIKAQGRVAAAQAKYRTAQAAVPPATEMSVAPATPQDREKLQKELGVLEKQIADVQGDGGKKQLSDDASNNWVVKLETEHANLRRQVNEQRETVNSLAASVFRASIDANGKLAETGGRLAVVDPAFAPTRPSGPGKTIFLIAGMMLFLTLGLGLSLGLAVIDDRIYRRTDLDDLGITVLAVIPPTAKEPKS